MINQNKFNNISLKHKILIAPLGWGLGHATRCIPIIHQLLAANCEVIVAAEGAGYSLLKNEFTQVLFLAIPGYRIKYSRKKSNLPWKILSQLPKIAFTIYKENRWLKRIITQYKIDAVVSDNRFGMYNSGIPCVYITHQLQIKTGNTFTEKIARTLHFYFIKKYKECWVPDFEKNGLGGELSHPENLSNTIKYIGAISRFELATAVKKYDLLISISGPEPQRTIFENQILNELKYCTKKVLFIRGLPDQSEELKHPNNFIEIKNHLCAKQFNQAILQSDMVISRCGYTTIMDLIRLQKKAILIPTPGQTEQEYLATYLMEKKIFYTVNQKDFVLQHSVDSAKRFPFIMPEYDMEQYKNIIHQFVLSL